MSDRRYERRFTKRESLVAEPLGMALTVGSPSRQKFLPVDGKIAVMAAGVVTPVGVSAAQTNGSIRSGMGQLKEAPGLYLCVPQDSAFDPPEPVVVSELGFTNRQSVGIQEQSAWLAHLLTLAFVDLLRAAPQLRRDGSRTGLFVALPLPRQGLVEEAAKPILVDFYNGARVDALGLARLHFGGHAGFFALLMDACEAILDGRIDSALVGGVDSYLFHCVLADLDHAYRLKSGRNFEGFRPGEGAGMVLLQSPRGTERKPMALLDRVSSSTQSPGSEALAQVLRGLVPPGAAPPLVVCDLNGETARAREWATVATRMGEALGDAAGLLHPAIATGDLGAASGPVLLGYAIHALGRAGASGRQACVYASSDDSVRAGASLRLPSTSS